MHERALHVCVSICVCGVCVVYILCVHMCARNLEKMNRIEERMRDRQKIGKERRRHILLQKCDVWTAMHAHLFELSAEVWGHHKSGGQQHGTCNCHHLSQKLPATEKKVSTQRKSVGGGGEYLQFSRSFCKAFFASSAPPVTCAHGITEKYVSTFCGTEFNGQVDEDLAICFVVERVQYWKKGSWKSGHIFVESDKSWGNGCWCEYETWCSGGCCCRRISGEYLGRRSLGR
jgi:hypothetical protein